MTNRCYAILAIAPLILPLASCSWLGIGYGVNAKCDKQTVAQVDSPGGKWQAATVRNTCEYSNTKWSTTMVEVGHAQQEGRTTVFTASNGSPGVPMNWPDLKVEWKSDTEAWIIYPAGYHTTCTSTDAVGVTVHCADASISR